MRVSGGPVGLRGTGDPIGRQVSEGPLAMRGGGEPVGLGPQPQAVDPPHRGHPHPATKAARVVRVGTP
ncbi:hypothetical protein SRB17_18750 [Streptomyces sp. RB17]|nr:hypothetical protein [Streptomyces sp. RB17]